MNPSARGRSVLPILAMSIIAAWPTPAAAIGAVAVGLDASGVSLGAATQYPSISGAETRAMVECRKNGSEESKRQCKVVMNFHDRCVAFIIDPEPGTPGFGWAVADTQAEAVAQALARCRATAGPTRVDYCTAKQYQCDGNAK